MEAKPKLTIDISEKKHLEKSILMTEFSQPVRKRDDEIHILKYACQDVLLV